MLMNVEICLRNISLTQQLTALADHCLLWNSSCHILPFTDKAAFFDRAVKDS